MIGLVRAATLCAALVLGLVSAQAADKAFRRSDFRSGLQILGQIAAVAPEDSGNWLRLARVIFQIVPKNSSEQTFLLERASTAAYIAYQRAGHAGAEAGAPARPGRG